MVCELSCDQSLSGLRRGGVKDPIKSGGRLKEENLQKK